MIAKIFQPNVLSFGFALILSINTTSVWGGVFPFLAPSAQTSSLTMIFYLLQLSSLVVTYIVFLYTSWTKPHIFRGMGVLSCSIPLALGSLLLVTAIYIPSIISVLVICGAILMGVGTAIFMSAWQCVLAARSYRDSNRAVIQGAGLSAIIYFAICLIPPALTAFLIPLVLVPLAGLCLWISIDATERNLPIFNDTPAEHAAVYKNAFRESLSPALSAGALAYCMGAMRFIAISSQSLLDTVNIVSMVVLLISVFVLAHYWKKSGNNFNLMSAYYVAFPLVGAGMLILPFFGNTNTLFGIAITYAIFSLVNILVIIHCCHVSRIAGIHPMAIFTFYECIISVLQIIGYGIGYLSGMEKGSTVEQLALIAITALFILLISSTINSSDKKLHTERLDFLMLHPVKEGTNISKELEMTQILAEQKQSESSESRLENSTQDRISKRCKRIQDLYGLSAREAEIMERVGRGQTAVFIAQSLFISENTVRTHLKRVYAKLNVHKKQEMIAMIENVDLK